MTRYDQYKELDDQPTTLGDRQFIGVNMRLDPSQLPPGFVSEAINMRFRNGVAETRLGFTVLPWINKITVTTVNVTSITRVSQTASVTTATNHGYATNDVVSISGANQTEYNGNFIVTVTDGTHFNYTVSGAPATPATGTIVATTSATQSWGTVHGVGSFSDPFTLQDYIVIAADGGVYYSQASNTPQVMTLPAGTTITGNVEFSQAFDVLLMHRGPDEPTLMLPRITDPWQLVEQTASGNGTEAIPNATHSLFLQNRLFIPNDNDEIAVSDLNDYTRYVPVLQEFKVNQGSSDELVAIFKFNDTTIIALKERSLYALSNVYGNLSALQQDELTAQFGCVARKSIAHVGNDLWFLSELGVMSITQTEQNKLQGVVLPASDPIQPLIERINWNFASGAVGAFWDSKYYLAVPLDDAEVFGPERCPVDAFNIGADVIVTTTAGRTYRYTKSDADFSLVNGSETLTASGDFTAQGSTVTLNTGGNPSGSIREVFKGVNNVTLVYDFLNGAWSGYDESPGFAISSFHLFPYNGRQRLFGITNTGYLLLMEEDFEDQLALPYADLTIVEANENEDTVQVNGGTTVHLDYNQDANTANSLGSGTFNVTVMQQNMWADFDAFGGFSPGTDDPWTAPNTLPVPTATGVRFYGTNGRAPTVTIATSSNPQWASTETVTQPILATLTTRGYASPSLSLSDYQWGVFDVQTWAPQTTFEVISSGVNEVQPVIEDITRDRTAYYEPGDASPFELDNDNGDFLTPYRQDYSVELGDSTADGVTPDLALHTIEDGVPLDLHQEVRITERVNARGRSAQVRMTNEQGRIRVMAVALETNEDQLTAGTVA